MEEAGMEVEVEEAVRGAADSTARLITGQIEENGQHHMPCHLTLERQYGLPSGVKIAGV